MYQRTTGLTHDPIGIVDYEQLLYLGLYDEPEFTRLYC